MEPLLDNVVAEASRILNLSEAVCSGHHKQDRMENHIHPLKSSLYVCLGDVNLEKNKSDQQCSPANCFPLLSEIEHLKRELRDVQQKHQRILDKFIPYHSTQCGNSNSKLFPQQDFSLGEDQTQLHVQKRHVSNGNQNSIDSGGQIYKQQNNKISPEPDFKIAEIKIDSPVFDFKKAKDTIQALNHTVKTSTVMEDAKTLKLQLVDGEEKILCLQSKLRASELKFSSLEQKLFFSEQKLQSMQDRLITTNDKAFYLEEALRASEKVVQSLKKALLESETRANAAKGQLEFLQKQNLAHQKTAQKISESLTASEELWRRVPEIEMSLEHCKRQVDIFQHSLSSAKSMHTEELEQLTNQMEKQAMHQQNLQNEVLDLTKKLLHEQVREDLVGSFKCEEHLHKPMKAREGDKTQTNDQSNDMDNLCKKRQTGTTKHNILQHDMQVGKQPPGQEIGERPLQTSLNRLQEEFVELRENLNAVLRDDAEREDQRRWDWMKVLEKSQEWERRAGKLVDSLYFLQNHQMLVNNGVFGDGKDVASHTGKPYKHNCPEVIGHKVDIRQRCWPQKSLRPDSAHNKQCQVHPPNRIRYSDSMQDQKHNFQREGFHGNT